MITSEYKKVLQTKQEADKKLLELEKDYFDARAKQIFEDYPFLKSFAWTQYAPYFNDGDPCYFNVHRDILWFNDMNLEYEDYGDYSYEEYMEGIEKGYITNFETHKYDTKYKRIPLDTPGAKAAQAVKQLLSEFDDDQLERMFGEDCKVVVTKNGAEPEGYHHG